MNSMKKGLLVLVSFSVVLISVLGIVLANSAAPNPASFLSQEFACRANFNIGVINATISTNSNGTSALQSSLSKLQNDLSSVQGMNNASDIRNFVRSQYSSDAKSAISAIQSWRNTNKGHFAVGERSSLISSYDNLKATYDSCEKNVYYGIAQNRLQGYQNQIADFQNKSSQLEQRGFDVTALNQLIQDAQNQIVTPLQNALSAANDSASIMSAVQSYCLYDGCANGTNFHLDAKFQVNRINIVYTYLKSNATSLGLDSSTLAQIGQAISDAQSTLDSVGSSIYQGTQSKTIWNDTRNAYQLTNNLIKSAKQQHSSSSTNSTNSS